MAEHHPSHTWSGGWCSRCQIKYMDCDCEPESGCARKHECPGELHPIFREDVSGGEKS